MLRRCFIAVPLPPPIRAALIAAPAVLAGACPGVRWQKRPENLHLTLQFLGSVPEVRVQSLIHDLPARLADLATFELEVRGLGAFPSAGHANVVWAGIEDRRGTLAEIAARLQVEADPREAGRPFRPHVTLGRAQRHPGAPGGVDVRPLVERLVDVTFGRFIVDAVHLYESHLSRHGSTYQSLVEARLSGAAATAS